jgi:hypothetical protein
VVRKSTGRVTKRELHERNALRYEGVKINLPKLTLDRAAVICQRLHEIVADRLASDPALISRARGRLQQLRDANPHGATYHDRWERLLGGPLRTLVRKMTEISEEADTLRKASPFSVLVTEEERRRVFEELSISL